MILTKDMVFDTLKELGKATAREVHGQIYPGETIKTCDLNLNRINYKLRSLNRDGSVAFTYTRETGREYYPKVRGD